MGAAGQTDQNSDSSSVSQKKSSSSSLPLGRTGCCRWACVFLEELLKIFNAN